MENLIQRMVILGIEASSREIAQMLSAPIVRRSQSASGAQAASPAKANGGVQDPAPGDKAAVGARPASKERMASLKDAARIAAQQVERDLILESLRRMRWNRKETAKVLGVSYKTLLAKIRENGLDDEYPESAPLQSAG
jgi:DNA-binding NtrC family response regulator